MSVLAIRHGKAFHESNSGYRHVPSAMLHPAGQQQARFLGFCLESFFNLDPAETPVATAEDESSVQTAQLAGFCDIRTYSALNGASLGLDAATYHDNIRAQRISHRALDQTAVILVRPPKERVWIAHELLIAGLCKRLWVYQDRPLIPGFCEIRELPIRQQA